jgi:hypothetical protein
MSELLVNNTNVNYTSYYNLINFFAEFMSNHPSINSVGNEAIDEFDKREFQSYPVANIIISSVRFLDSVTEYDMNIIIADKYKNKNNESNDRTNAQTVSFYDVDDKMDVWVNNLAIMNDITAYIQRGVTGFDLFGDIRCEQFYERFDNGLAGWVISFTLTTHNNKNRCLFELYPQ